MKENTDDSFVELHITFETSLVVRFDKEYVDESDYVRRFTGDIELVVGEQEERTEIGEIEVWFIDGTRAQRNHLDIVEICDFITQDESDYAESVYTNGELDFEIVENPVSQDVMVLHRIAIFPEFRGRRYGLKVTEKLIETMGVHCGAVLLRPHPLQFSLWEDNAEKKLQMRVDLFPEDENEAKKKVSKYWKNLGLQSTKHPAIFCVDVKR